MYCRCMFCQVCTPNVLSMPCCMQDDAAAARSADKHQRSEALRAAHISRIRAKAGDETRKVRMLMD